MGLPLLTVAIGVARHFLLFEPAWLGANSLALLLAAGFYFWRGLEIRENRWIVLSMVILNVALALLWNELAWNDPALQINDTGYPDLTHYASRDWLINIISNPAGPRFYGEKNDRMPAFAADEKDPTKNILTRKQIELIVDWLRGDYAPHRGE